MRHSLIDDTGHSTHSFVGLLNRLIGRFWLVDDCLIFDWFSDDWLIFDRFAYDRLADWFFIGSLMIDWLIVFWGGAH